MDRVRRIEKEAGCNIADIDKGDLASTRIRLSDLEWLLEEVKQVQSLKEKVNEQKKVIESIKSENRELNRKLAHNSIQ